METSNGMRKTIFFSLIVVSFFIVAGDTRAHTDTIDGSERSVNTSLTPSQDSEVNSVLQNIYQSQNITEQGQIDCSKVTDDQFEKLGDTYMGVMLPNKQQHKNMDNMMGGEGSASLTQAHVNMGRSFLGCWSDYNSGPVYMPTSGAMMGTMMGGRGGYLKMNGNDFGYSMMGEWGNFGVGNTVFMLALWVLAIIGLVATIKWIINSSKK